MNAHRDLIVVSRELARIARERGLFLAAMHVSDAAREAEAQLAREENDRNNLRSALTELLAEPPPMRRCSSCGSHGAHLAEALNAHREREAAAKAQLKQLLNRLGGPVRGDG